MPGVNVITAARSGVTAGSEAAAATFFVAGLTTRGRTDQAVRVASLAEFENQFGGRAAYGFVYDAIRTYFAEGGTDAYVVRVVGDAATVGTLVLQHSSTTAAINVDARGAGAWSSNVTITVEAGTVAGTKKVTVTHDGDVEVFNNLATNVEVANKLTNQSKYVTATDLGEATLIDDIAATPLSAGDDDRASVASADYVAALDALAGANLGSGAVAVPGQPAGSVGAGLLAHAKATNRVALLATATGASSSDAVTAASDLRGDDGEFGGVFWPWLTIPDAGGATLTVPPEGYVAASRARAVRADGPWRAPAGEIAAATFVTGVETELTRADADALNESEVNVIRVIQGDVRLYGWRSLSDDEDNYRLLTGRDVLNYITVQAEDALEQYVFRPIDSRGQLFSDINAEVTGIVEPIRIAGGLYAKLGDDGIEVDSGYLVDTGPDVNTPSTIANNEARVALSVRVAPTGETITLLITKVSLNGSL